MKDREVLDWLLDQIGETREDVETTIKSGGRIGGGRLLAHGDTWEYPFVHVFRSRKAAAALGYYPPAAFNFRRSYLHVGPTKDGTGVYYVGGEW